ncbi:MAG: NAD(P)/FAD-dependent oxidoreductase, partial [Candidatus Competibacter sp.]|nr:NAD(P)/FAD-dependent oxidoreductase [Candidatus Competibacter sp.]
MATTPDAAAGAVGSAGEAGEAGIGGGDGFVLVGVGGIGSVLLAGGDSLTKGSDVGVTVVAVALA